MNKRNLTFAQAINEALHLAMKSDDKTLYFGLGADDPGRHFGTAKGLAEDFGGDRVFDMPTSENAMTGVAIGLAVQGFRPIMTHLRLDFFLLALDQLVNNAAKWHFMFGGKDSVPLTIRLIIGRGWGQGPTHSQNLQAWFAHIPGLKVVSPSLAEDAKGLLLSSIADPSPVVFLEHRWLHHQTGSVPEGDVKIPLGKANRLREGDAVTIVAMSYMTIEALRAHSFLESQGVHCDLIDLRTIRPLDWDCIKASVQRTGRLLALDTAASSFSVSSEIVSRVAIECFDSLKAAPQKLASPDFAVPTSFGLSEGFYPGAKEISGKVLEMLGKTADLTPLINKNPHDVPGEWFKGPF